AEGVEQVGAASVAGGHDERAVAQAFAPRDRGGPLRFRVGSGWTVVGTRMTFSPTTLEVDPRQRVARVGDLIGEHDDPRVDTCRRRPGVVASEPFGAATPEIQRRRGVARVRSL